MKKAIFVLGMHRSGTSALTRVLNLCGVPLAADLIPPRANDNETGFWESASIVEIHEELLTSAGSSEDDFLEFPQSWFGSSVAARFKQRILAVLEDCFASEPLFLLKDPRICRLVPFWLDVLADFGAEPGFVLITRHPLEIAASLKRRNEFDSYKSLLLWLQHFLSAERDTRNQPRVFITYDQLLQDWREVVPRIASQLQVTFPRSLASVTTEVEAFLRPDLWHHREKTPDLSVRGDIVSWIAQAFDWAIAASEGQAVAPEPLDAIRSAVREAEKAYGPIVARAESQRIIHLKAEVRTLTGELEKLHQEVQSRDRQISSLMTHEVQARELQISRLHNELQSRDRQVNQLNQEIQNRDRQVNQLNQEIQDRDRQVNQLNQEIQNRDRQVNQLNQRIQDRDRQLTKLNQAIQDRDRQVKKISKKVQAYQAHLASIENSKAWQLISAIRKLIQPAEFLKSPPQKEVKLADLPSEPDKLQIVPELDKPQIVCQLAIDLAILVPERGIFLQGWLVDSEAPVKALSLEIEAGESVQFKHLLCPYSRPDILQNFKAQGIELVSDCVGFFCLVPLQIQVENVSSFTIIAELMTGGQQKFAFSITETPANPLPLIQQVLSFVHLASSKPEKLLDGCLGPAVSTLWQKRNFSNKLEAIEYGRQPDSPEVSVIVPIYGQIDFLKFQLSLFANDTDFQANELIYMLDDPRLAEDLLQLCSQVSPIFKVPFKVIYMDRNLAYAAANNLAVTQAKGKYLILLNSDVMPKKGGWITDLKTTYQSLSQVGAIAPKLLFEDDSIQQAGIQPYKSHLYPHLWFNEYPNRGLPNSLMTDSSPIQVPAVTGACLMVERELYLQQEGMSEDYILGDFADSDFCFRLHQSGLRNYYIPTVEMYHLESQSQNLISESQWQQALHLYNSWVFTKQWDGFISRLKIKN